MSGLLDPRLQGCQTVDGHVRPSTMPRALARNVAFPAEGQSPFMAQAPVRCLVQTTVRRWPWRKKSYATWKPLLKLVGMRPLRLSGDGLYAGLANPTS